MPAERIAATLGPAGFVRRDGRAEIWRYASEDCFLDLFVYREAGEPRVAHVEARPRGSARVTPRGCYERMLALRREAPAS
jgi:hypothetical protein